MKILSLDMSTKKTGWAYYDETTKELQYGVWQISDKDEKNWRKRISYMGEQLRSFFDKNNVDYIYLEDSVPSIENSQTVKILSALQGYMLAFCDLKNIPYDFVSVAWKRHSNMDLTHSKEINRYKKMLYGSELTSFKRDVKAYEKKMSVDNANNFFNLELKYVSSSSSKNEDDIADAINILAIKLFGESAYYNLREKEDILEEIYKKHSTKKSLGKKVIT